MKNMCLKQKGALLMEQPTAGVCASLMFVVLWFVMEFYP